MKLFAKTLILMIAFAYICCTCSSSENITLFANSVSKNSINFNDPNSSPSECQNREFSETEKMFYEKCCYLEMDCDFSDEETTNTKYTGCFPFLESQIRQGFSLYKQICKTFKVSCTSSSYLGMSLILLIIILL